MSEQGGVKAWLWIVMEKAGGEENIYALEDESTGQKMLPAFESQEDAAVCQRNFQKKSGAQYDVEAMQLAVLAQTARRNHADIVILDYSGKILERLTPTPDA